MDLDDPSQAAWKFSSRDASESEIRLTVFCPIGIVRRFMRLPAHTSAIG
jgi:hypothetical protein